MKAISVIQPREDENIKQHKSSPDKEKKCTGLFSHNFNTQKYYTKKITLKAIFTQSNQVSASIKYW